MKKKTNPKIQKNKNNNNNKKTQPHWGRMYKPTRLRVSFTGNFITVL